MKTYVVTALNDHVQPVGVYILEAHAHLEAENYSRDWNTNTEVLGFEGEIWFSTHRFFSRATQKDLENARIILDKYFVTDVNNDDYDENYVLGLDYHVFTIPQCLLATEARELMKLNFEFHSNDRTFSYKFYTRWK